MGRASGTGQPITFVCPVARRNRVGNVPRLPPGHDRIVRTGRRKRRAGMGGRMLHTSHEYRCSCGHVGWSAHIDVMRYPCDGAEMTRHDGWCFAMRDTPPSDSRCDCGFSRLVRR